MEFRFFVRFPEGSDQIDLAVSEGTKPDSYWLDQGFERVPYPAFRTAWDGQARLTFFRMGLRPALQCPE